MNPESVESLAHQYKLIQIGWWIIAAGVPLAFAMMGKRYSFEKAPKWRGYWAFFLTSVLLVIYWEWIEFPFRSRFLEGRNWPGHGVASAVIAAFAFTPVAFLFAWLYWKVRDRITRRGTGKPGGHQPGDVLE